MSPAGQLVTFGPFILDLSADTLQREGVNVTLRPQARRVLKLLVSHSGLHISHDQMIQQAWDGVVVSKHTVTVTMAEVKRALGEYAAWIQCHPRLGYRLEVPESENLLRLGWHHLNRHTREGLEKAVQCFEQAARSTVSESRAVEGASRALLQLGAMALRAPEAVYPQFLAMHQRAVELRGYTAELRSDRGLALHAFERKFPEAEAQLLAAIAEQPRLADAYCHLAMLYISWHRFDEANAMVRAARAADALSPGLALIEILVRFCSRDFEAAVEHGAQVLELHPHFAYAIVFHASALEKLGRFDEALEFYRRVCVMAPDITWHHAMEGACLAKLGRRSEAEAALEEVYRQRRTVYVPSYHTALLLHALGYTDAALQELESAYERGCPVLVMLDVDPKFDDFHGHPRFEALRARILGSTVAQAC